MIYDGLYLMASKKCIGEFFATGLAFDNTIGDINADGIRKRSIKKLFSRQKLRLNITY